MPTSGNRHTKQVRSQDGASSTGTTSPRRKKARSSEDETCSICMENPTNDRCSIDVCNHIFCFPCIREWSRRENTCPLCRIRFTRIKHQSDSGNKERTTAVEHSIEIEYDASDDISYFTIEMFGRYLRIGGSNDSSVVYFEEENEDSDFDDSSLESNTFLLRPERHNVASHPPTDSVQIPQPRNATSVSYEQQVQPPFPTSQILPAPSSAFVASQAPNPATTSMPSNLQSGYYTNLLPATFNNFYGLPQVSSNSLNSNYTAPALTHPNHSQPQPMGYPYSGNSVPPVQPAIYVPTQGLTQPVPHPPPPLLPLHRHTQSPFPANTLSYVPNSQQSNNPPVWGIYL